MEEVEGLLISPPKNPKNAVDPISMCNRAYRGRWGICIFAIIAVVCILFVLDSEQLRFREGKGGEYVDDVESKNTTIPKIPSTAPTAKGPPNTPAPVPATTAPSFETVAPVPATAEPLAIGDSLKSSGIPDDNTFGFTKPDQIVRVMRPGAVELQGKLATEWGKWEFTDPKAESRPKHDYCGEFGNRDIPRVKFPKDAWQVDKDYLAAFLDEGIKLVNRSMEAILAEYGKGTNDMPGDDFVKRSEMFQFSFLNFSNGDTPSGGKELQENGGWTDRKSFEGLKRRILHALMTNDSFGVILGGHSAAAGHGNSFKQSYIMQFHKVMEPVFAMLNIPLTSRNLAQGGLGTLHSALGARSIYGDEIDIMIWDSGMTEGRDGGAVDLFERQALIGGNRVPMLLGGNFGNLKMLHDECGADIGHYGSAMLGIPTCEDEIQALKIPYASRYMKCSNERRDLCSTHKFDSICWPEDYSGPIAPDTQQDATPGSQVSWHPGNLSHQLTGRIIAMMVLLAINEVLTQWKATPDFTLPDELWHVTEYYKDIRNKVRALPFDVGDCMKAYDGKIPIRVCNTTLYGATEFTPRANPDKTSIQTLLKPAANGYIPHASSAAQYTGPGPYNPKLDPPEGAVDVLAIISNGRSYDALPPRIRKLDVDVINPGLGWQMSDSPAGYCDGTWNSECGREPGTTCLLSGHSDRRGGLIMDGYSGWLVLTLPAILEGIIMLKIETWHSVMENSITRNWKSINNERRSLRHASPPANNGNMQFEAHEFEANQRLLKAQPPDYCDKFRFEYAIDGHITSLDKQTFAQNFTQPLQRVVEIQTLLDDPDYTKGETRPVEVGIRMLGCHDTTGKAMKLTHIYWA